MPVFSFGPMTHVYVSRNMKDIWQDYDPQFYNILLASETNSDETTYEQMVQKFYYIGTTLPDMFDYQDAISTLLYHLRLSFLLLGPTAWAQLELQRPNIYVQGHTVENTQTRIIFIDPPPNQNIVKLREMVEYAKNHNWTPYEKALIYGCYVHCLEDIIAHMILQPGTYGYGRNIDSPILIDRDILGAGEMLEEMFTETHIPDWNFTQSILFSGFEHEPGIFGGDYVTRRTMFGFFKEYRVDPFPWNTYYMGFQDSNFVPVQKFVEAAQAVGYNIQNLTRERLEAYIHGWGIILFGVYGFCRDGSNIGGIASHPNWTLLQSLNYVSSLIDQSVFFLDGRAELVDNLLSDLLATYVLLRPFIMTATIPGPLPVNIGIPFIFLLDQKLLQCSASLNFPIVSYIENPQLFSGIKSCLTPYHPEIIDKVESTLYYYDSYSTTKKPNYRSTYSDQINEILHFKNFIKSMINGGDFIWYNLDEDRNPFNVFHTSRKSGILGGMWDVDYSREYYYQPGIFKMHFEDNGNVVYTGKNAELDVPSYVNLRYDIIPFGKTLVLIKGNRVDTNGIEIATIGIQNNNYVHLNLTYPINLYEPINNGIEEIYFEVWTYDKQTGKVRQKMLSSDYREGYYSTSGIYNNPLYRDSLFKNGNPYRLSGENPISNPKRYWPYVLPINPVLTKIARPENLNAEVIGTDPISVRLTWIDKSNYEDHYILVRGELGSDYNWSVELPQNTTSYIDTTIPDSSKSYWYKICCRGQGIYSEWSNPETLKIDKDPPVLSFVTPYNNCVIKKGNVRVTWDIQEEFAMHSCTLYYPLNKKIGVPGWTNYVNVPFECEGIGGEYKIRLKGIDNAGNVGYAEIRVAVFDPENTNMSISYTISPNNYVTITTSNGIFNRVYSRHSNLLVLPSEQSKEKWIIIYDNCAHPRNTYTDPHQLGGSFGESAEYFVCSYSCSDTGHFSMVSNIISTYSIPQCPLLYILTDTGYVFENSLLPRCEYIQEDYTDYYKFLNKPKEDTIELQIIENRDIVFIDCIKIITVDHPAGLDVGILPDGEIISYKKTNANYRAIDNNGRDWTDLVKREGKGEWRGRRTDWLLIDYEPWNFSNYIIATLRPEKTPIEIAMNYVYTRAKEADYVISVPETLFKIIPQETLGIVDYIGFIRRLPDSNLMIKECEGIEIPDEIKEEDGDYYVIRKNEKIYLSFKEPEKDNQGFEREYVIKIKGRYEKGVLKASLNRKETKRIIKDEWSVLPLSSFIFIRYESDKEKKINVYIYDITGRRIKESIFNVNEGSNDIRIEWAKKGIYFIRIGERMEKCVIIR